MCERVKLEGGVVYIFVCTYCFAQRVMKRKKGKGCVQYTLWYHLQRVWYGTFILQGGVHEFIMECENQFLLFGLKKFTNKI